jgi:hypothetical protein
MPCMNQLNVPWDKIKEACESGMSLSSASKVFDIKIATLKARSLRHQWSTPKRREALLNEKIKAHEEQDNRVAGPQKQLAIANAIREEQLNGSEPSRKRAAASAPVDFDEATKDYRNKGVQKMAKILDATVIAPPRTWKDYDIADKMMRRLLGIDDNEGKSNTIVSLQLVNDRLAAGRQDDIVEGDFIEESVPEVSHEKGEQRELTGCESAPQL